MSWQTALVVLAVAAPGLGAHAGETTRYEGICDASAAVALDAAHFAVADDEHNTLRVYRRGQAVAVAGLPLAALLGTAADQESDLEGAAVVGRRVYWIASHGRNSSGKLREARQRFFAMEIDTTAAAPTLRGVGQAYTQLLADLLASGVVKEIDLRAAAQRAPESPGGLNIEGLAATPDGSLLIGFRNPLHDGKALLVTLDNPHTLVEPGSKPGPAKFSRAVWLDLGGRGVRSVERVEGNYLIVAGPAADAGSFALYRWSGKVGDAARQVPTVDFGDLRPEALFQWPQTQQLQVLSDDGGVLLHGKACKDLGVGRRSFRAATPALPR
jgi:hypothetical protein